MESHQQREIRMHKTLVRSYRIRYKSDFSNIFQRYWNNAVVNRIPEKTRSVLDLGCGTGVLIDDLVAKCKIVLGLDLSHTMIKEVTCNHPHLKGLVVGDIAALPFVPGAFDVIVCRGVLHHFPDLVKSLRQIRNILTKDGILVFSEPSNDFLLVRFARKILYKRSLKFDPLDASFLTKELVLKVLECGFRLKSLERFGYLAYVFLGFPDHLNVMKFLPGNKVIAKGLVAIDRLLSRIPVVKDASLHVLVTLQNDNAH